MKLCADSSIDARVARFVASELKANTLQSQPDGSWAVDLNGLKHFNDLAIFQGTPVSILSLNRTDFPSRL